MSPIKARNKLAASLSVLKVMAFPIKILLKNRLEKEVQSMFYPFNIVLTIFFSSKYRIRDNYITTSLQKYCVLKILSIFFVVGATIRRVYHNAINCEYNTTTMLFLSYILPTTRCLGFIISFIVAVAYRHKNVLLIMLIQVIHKAIDFSKSVRSFIIFNWTLVTTIILIDLFCFIIFGASFNYFDFLNCIVEIIFISFDIDFIYAIRILVLLIMYLDEWIEIVQMMNGDQENDKVYCNRLHETYQNILKAYRVYRSVFQVMILYRTFNAFYRNLCFFELILQMYQLKGSSADEVPVTHLAITLLSTFGIIKDIIHIIIHCVYSEKFYIAVEEAEIACIKRMKNRNYTQSEARLCKNVLRQKRTFSKMTACGLFWVDAALPMSLMGLLTNYAVVLLQFAFL